MRFTVNFHHDGTFVPSPLMYQEGDESTIRDIEFEGMTVIRLSKLLQGTCMFLVKAMIEGWSAGCRKVIGLDGCFLKSTCRGELLTAMGRDGNNQMFTIAWVVVNVENNDNWDGFWPVFVRI
ncbi:60S ribosomal protein L34 [Tanacetum coccineum]